MRIQLSEDRKKKHIDNSVRINLSGGYNRELWNQETSAVFLVSDNDSITTVIPEEDIGLEEELDQCQNCDAVTMSDCRLDNCYWCGETDYEEPVTSLEAGSGSPQ